MNNEHSGTLSALDLELMVFKFSSKMYDVSTVEKTDEKKGEQV